MVACSLTPSQAVSTLAEVSIHVVFAVHSVKIEFFVSHFYAAYRSNKPAFRDSKRKFHDPRVSYIVRLEFGQIVFQNAKFNTFLAKKSVH